mmetsp:Transcript_17467/g.22758  ORF Transcript_17467/g.22758 Transcript_17467/m.22758 type:complete len:202 (+) Transcript_17467:1163-1768(+)
MLFLVMNNLIWLYVQPNVLVRLKITTEQRMPKQKPKPRLNNQNLLIIIKCSVYAETLLQRILKKRIETWLSSIIRIKLTKRRKRPQLKNFNKLLMPMKFLVTMNFALAMIGVRMFLEIHNNSNNNKAFLMVFRVFKAFNRVVPVVNAFIFNFVVISEKKRKIGCHLAVNCARAFFIWKTEIAMSLSSSFFKICCCVLLLLF